MPFIYADENCANTAGKLPEEFLNLWTKCALSTHQADPVCCAPNWNITFHGCEQAGWPIYYASDDSSVLVLVVYPVPPSDAILAPMENGWLFGNPLMGPRALNLLADSLPIFAEKFYPSFPLIDLSGIREGALQTHALYFKFKNAFDFYQIGTSVQCAASLAGGLDGWLGRRSANHRAKLKKSARKCRENGIVFDRFRPQNREEADAVFARMLAVEEKSWKGIGDCGMTQDISSKFYNALIRRLALDRSAFVILARREDADVGFIFGGGCGHIYRGQQFSYAEEVKSLSLGNVLQLEKIKWLCELDFWRYDMGPVTGPRMEYKRHWTEIENTIHTWRMRKKS